MPSVFLTFDFQLCFAPQQCALFRHLNFQKWSEHVALLTCSLGNVIRATTACHNGVHIFDSSTWKSGSKLVCFLHFDLEMCHNCVHFFDSSTWKSCPKLVLFMHFDVEMCFAPQRRALVRQHNFQKWSENGVICTFWLGNVLRATTACNFSSLIWPPGSAPAALASLLFDHPEPQIIGKTKWIATFLPFRAPASSFFSLCLFSALLTSWLLLSDSPHLCFPICPYCRKFGC